MENSGSLFSPPLWPPCLFVRIIILELNDVSPRLVHLGGVWVRVEGHVQGHGPGFTSTGGKNVAKLVGATSSAGFPVCGTSSSVSFAEMLAASVLFSGVTV